MVEGDQVSRQMVPVPCFRFTIRHPSLCCLLHAMFALAGTGYTHDLFEIILGSRVFSGSALLVFSQKKWWLVGLSAKHIKTLWMQTKKCK